MIPPSALAVLLGSIGEISIGDILLAIIIPGGIMAVLYFTYIVIRILLQPDLAPHYESQAIPIMKKITLTVRYVLPVGIIVFLVVGVIFLGVATPTEAASTGALGTFGLVALYGKLNWRVVKKALSSGLWTSGMVLMIVLGAKSYSEALAFSGASLGLAEFVSSLNVGPMTIFISMQVVILFLGMFMSSTAVVMVTLPIFLPIIRSLGFNEIWFAVVMLLNLEIGMTSPPFGLNLFVMKSVAPTGTSMGDIIRAALPFIYCDIVAMLLIIIFPSLALWLPGLKF